MAQGVEGLGQRDALSVPIDRDAFLRRLFGHLTSALEEIIGLREVSGLFSVVGQALGDEIDRAYRAALSTSELTRQQVAGALVDFERRLGSDFHLIEQDDERIVLGCRSCGFADAALARPTICALASNVCGVIAAQNLGYARVVVEQAITTSAAGCRVVIHLRVHDGTPAEGREFFRGP
jgi:predicted ArsR family transcriptional regulator